MPDIVERLREAAKFGGHYADAADEIERLRGALELAEEAVKMLIRTSDIELEHRRRAFTMLDRARAGGSPKCDTEKG